MATAAHYVINQNANGTTVFRMTVDGSTFTNVLVVDAYGVCTIGPASGAVTHNINGRLNFNTTEASAPANGLRLSSANTLKFSTSSADVGVVSSTGGWTLGPVGTTTTVHALNGQIAAVGTSIAPSDVTFRGAMAHFKNAGTAASILDSNTVTFPFGSGSGTLVVVTNVTSGNSALFFAAGGTGITEVSDPSATFSITSNTASSTNVTVSGGTITLQNKTGGTANYKLVAVSTI